MFTTGLVLFLVSLAIAAVTAVVAVRNMLKVGDAVFDAAASFGRRDPLPDQPRPAPKSFLGNHLKAMAVMAVTGFGCIAGLVLMIVSRLL